mgnify:CR=1 FL=1
MGEPLTSAGGVRRDGQQGIVGDAFLAWGLVAFGMFFAGYFVTLQIPSSSQLLLGILVTVLAYAIIRLAPQLRLLVVVAAGMMSARYLYWRATYTLNGEDFTTMVISFLLLAAEAYAVAILLLGFFQTAESIERTPDPLPDDPGQWPSVDIFVPSYNEPVQVILPTLIGCKAIDYPNKKIYLLDDGSREEMRALAAKLGIGYITRDNNEHAKAGNINAAMKQTDGDFVAIFDADHIPTRAFLQLTMGFFTNDNVALVQTPHHFFNADPFERNLQIYGTVPGEQNLFYHQIQPASDFWNAVYFCGSCAVIRRSALEEIGGIATETVTEDCHTSLRLHAKGYLTRYLNVPLAAGLAPERFSAHITQRMRWARGMIQILRVDNPLTKPGLTWAQRLCYFNAMVHFMFGVPRVIYMLAPACYLVLNRNTIIATAFDVVAYALPHIFVAMFANSLTSRNLRHSFWAEVYETAICYYTAIATTVTLLRPKAWAFGVTRKGFDADGPYYDWRSARPVFAFIAVNLLAVLFIGYRANMQPDEGSAILINSVWSVYNLIILGACVFVAYEQPAQGSLWRHERQLPMRIVPEGANPLWSETRELSIEGVQATLPAGTEVPRRGRLDLYYEFGGSYGLPFETTWRRDASDGSTEVGLRFTPLDFDQQCEVYQAIFGSAANWIDTHFEDDRPLRSFGRVIATPFRAWRNAWRYRNGSTAAEPVEA